MTFPAQIGIIGFGTPGQICRAIRVSRRVRAGTVHVNAGTMAPNMPFGGFKQSGLGREGGAEGIAAFVETKTINLAG